MIYLIDYENVNEGGLNGIETLTQDDTLIIFYNETQKLSMDIHRLLEKAVCKKDYVKVNKSAKNYLDFQLSTYLGYLVAKNKDVKFKIISKDTGFDAVINFWKGRQTKIERNNDLTKNSVELLRSQVDEALKNSHIDFKVNVNELVDMIMYYKTKTNLNKGIMKKYSSEETGKIYAAIKPLIKDKKGQ